MFGLLVLYLAEPRSDFECFGIRERKRQGRFEDSKRGEQAAPVLEYSVDHAVRPGAEFGVCEVVGIPIPDFDFAAFAEDFVR